MQEKFIQNIRNNNLIQNKEKTLLAVSGGLDSVVMAFLFHKSGLPFAIAHCNFKLRGNDSDLDESFTRQLAQKLGVKFYSKEFQTEKYAEENRISVQMAAREIRYSWLEEIRQTRGYDKIATAHHLDDNTETILINLIRGTGLKGLQGIPVKYKNLIRPMLIFSREEIKQYAGVEKISYREDLSNLEDKYIRNKLRHKVIPVLKEINPSLDKSIETLSDISSKTHELFHFLIERGFQGKIVKKDGKTFIPIDEVLTYPHPELILYQLLKDFGFQSPVISDIAANLEEQAGKLFFSESFICLKDRDFLIISPRKHREQEEFEIKKGQDFLQIPGIQFHFNEIKAEVFTGFTEDKNTAWLDLSKLKFPMILRHPREGDNFSPLGMSGKKKISDFLTDLKIPRTEKSDIWLLTSGGEIAWVVGLRIDERFRVRKTTRKILEIKMQRQNR